jgi:hypothetical protein
VFEKWSEPLTNSLGANLDSFSWPRRGEPQGSGEHMGRGERAEKGHGGPFSANYLVHDDLGCGRPEPLGQGAFFGFGFGEAYLHAVVGLRELTADDDAKEEKAETQGEAREHR